MIGQALEIMLFGMLGIFLVMSFIIFVIKVLDIIGGGGESSNKGESSK